MTDFEWEVLEDIYTWADDTNFDIEADRKTMIDAYWADMLGVS
jgi:hypothetical protein